MDIVDLIMLVEGGDCTQEEFVAAFQQIIDAGLESKLQGWYGRTAQALIEQGLCHPREVKR